MASASVIQPTTPVHVLELQEAEDRHRLLLAAWGLGGLPAHPSQHRAAQADHLGASLPTGWLLFLCGCLFRTHRFLVRSGLCSQMRHLLLCFPFRDACAVCHSARLEYQTPIPTLLPMPVPSPCMHHSACVLAAESNHRCGAVSEECEARTVLFSEAQSAHRALRQSAELPPAVGELLEAEQRGRQEVTTGAEAAFLYSVQELLQDWQDCGGRAATAMAEARLRQCLGEEEVGQRMQVAEGRGTALLCGNARACLSSWVGCLQNSLICHVGKCEFGWCSFNPSVTASWGRGGMEWWFWCAPPRDRRFPWLDLHCMPACERDCPHP